MKKILIIITLFAMISCNDDFMERFPETKITKENFFNTATDLNTYANGFYEYVEAPYDDIGSDNIAQREAKDETWDLIHGAISEDTENSWEWDNLRHINFYLENLSKADATDTEKAHYEGIGRYFRAMFYIDKLKTYSDVPWYSRTLQTTDEDLLYKTQDSRGMVVDSIVGDLQFAAANISLNSGDKTRISKYAALAGLARFSLYEGTFRKYGMMNGTEAAYLSSKNASEFNSLLQIAKDASQKIMDEGGFSLSDDYAGLFNSTGTKLASNPEIILFVDYEPDIRTHISATRLDWQYNLSQNLVDEYLKSDGTVYTRSELDTLQYRYTFENRDPRLMATVSYPGYTTAPSTTPHVAKTLFGGLGQIKYTPLEADAWSWDKGYNDLPVYRYSEILLINAEAHAELASLTNAVLDNTVNKLRERAGITGGLVTANANVDPILQKNYPNVSGSNQGAMLEIRRERRVELACEGLRFDDLMRWHVGDAILTVNGNTDNLQRGMYVPKMTVTGGAKFTLLEVTGDDEADIIIAETAADLVKAEAYYSGVDAEFYQGLNKVSLDETIGLKNGDEGHIIWDREVDDPGTFVEPKHYYRPVSKSDILLNQSLVQNEFWN